MIHTHAFLLAAALAAMPLAYQPDPVGGGPLGLSRARVEPIGNAPWHYTRSSQGLSNYQVVGKSQVTDNSRSLTVTGGR